MQIFIRGKSGTKKFEAWANQRGGKIASANNPQNTAVLALINRLTELRAKKAQLEDKMNFLDAFLEIKSPELKAIENEIARLEQRLTEESP